MRVPFKGFFKKANLQQPLDGPKSPQPTTSTDPKQTKATTKIAQAVKNEISSQELAQLISQKLRSQKVEKLRESTNLSENFITQVVLNYFLLIRDDSDFNKYIDQVQAIEAKRGKKIERDDSADEILFDLLKDKLGISKPESEQDRKKVLEYFLETYSENGFVFHAFNGAFEDSIKEHGLDPNLRSWDTEESERMFSILKKHGAESLVGCYEQTSDKIYFSSEARTCWNYAKSSPEWFSRMCSNGEVDDYEYSKGYVEHRTEAMPAEDRDFIRSLFTKYWQEFTGDNAKPKLALIKRSALGLNELPGALQKKVEDAFLELDRDKLSSNPREPLPYKQSINSALKFSMQFHLGLLNCATKERIAPENISIVSLVDRAK